MNVSLGHQRRTRRTRVAAIVALAAMIATTLLAAGLPHAAAAPGPGGAVFRYSTSSSYSSPKILQGAKLSGRVAMFLAEGTIAFDTVTFAIDGRTVRTENSAPWDLSGNDAGGSFMFDVSRLATGRHTVSARITHASGTSTASASFTAGLSGSTSPPLRYSTSAAYTSPLPLQGATLTGRVAIFLPAAPDTASVALSLDGQWVRTERVAPYDLSGDTGGRSRLLDVSALSPGSHTVRAVLTSRAGRNRTVTARFTRGGSASSTKTLTVSGTSFRLDGAAFDMWGVRTASATVSQAQTDHLIAQLDTYKAHGVNAVTVFYMGSRNANYCPFSADGRRVNAGHQSRMEQIIRAADSRGMVVISGIFYAAAPFCFRDGAAVREAVRTVTTKLRPYRNVIINIANEHNTGEYSDSNAVFNMWDPTRIIELEAIVNSMDPSRLVGGGGYHRGKNIAIGRSSQTDVLLFDTAGSQMQLPEYRAFRAAGITNKPIVNVETFGSRTDDYPRGVFPSDLRSKYLTEVRTADEQPGLSVFLHNTPWIQVLPMRYDLGGQGTPANPGIRWYFEAVRAARAS